MGDRVFVGVLVFVHRRVHDLELETHEVQEEASAR
jgi:hypothetical protein